MSWPRAPSVSASASILTFLLTSQDRRPQDLDEPSASFTTEETRRLLTILNELKAHSTAVLYVTHRLGEIEGMIDQVTVLRDGRKVGELTHAEATQERVVSLMVGRELEHMYPHPATPPGETLMSTTDFRRKGAFEQVSLTVRGGEIVSLVGLAGHGSFEVAHSLVALPPPDAGEIRVDRSSVRDALASGIGFFAEDRADTILRVRTVRENLALGALEMWSRMGFVDTRREANEADRLIKALSVRCRSPTALAESLSGGNQQKLALVLLDPGSGDPPVGNTYQLSSISPAVLGGVDLFGGRGTVWGAIAGAFVSGMIGNVLNLLGVVAYWQWTVQGLVLLLAVGLMRSSLDRRERPSRSDAEMGKRAENEKRESIRLESPRLRIGLD